MKYRLLVDLEVIVILDTLPKRVRTQLVDHFEKLRSTPERYIAAYERDEVGRPVEISVCANYCVHYWIDFADRHVKVLAVTPAGK